MIQRLLFLMLFLFLPGITLSRETGPGDLSCPEETSIAGGPAFVADSVEEAKKRVSEEKAAASVPLAIPAELANSGGVTLAQEEKKSADDNYYSTAEFSFAGNRYYTISGGTALRETSIRPLPALAVAAGYAGIVTALHIAQRDAWWKDRSNFHFEEDWEFARQVDKAGHTYSGYFTSYWWSHALMESGFGWEAATWTGAAMGLLYQTYVEIEDGQSVGWGFSPSDEYANLFGAAFFVAQHYTPFLQNFTPKWQYVPASWSKIAERGNGGTFIDDYNSSSFWMGVNVHGLLPDGAKPYWPEWLMLTAGYAVRGVEVAGERPTRYGLLSLDYNLVEILPEGPGFWNWIRQTMNHVKLPSPTVEFGPTTKFYLFYPFRISTGNIQF